jgi:hypothetical protein
MRATPNLFAGPIACDGCYRTIWWPRWAPNGDGEYLCLCERCHYRPQRDFTADLAVWEAIALVAFFQANRAGSAVAR